MNDSAKKVLYHYGQFSDEHAEKLREGLELFNAEKFWECHEYLEDFWLEDVSDSARLIYWTVIQAANALFHWRDRNLNGAEGQLKKASEKLTRAETGGVETVALYNLCNWFDFKNCLRIVIAMEDRHEAFSTLANFKFFIKGGQSDNIG